MTKQADIEVKKQFLDLANQLSPENLSHDGELSEAEIRAKEKVLVENWRALEKLVGFRVGMDDAWEWGADVYRYRKEQLAKDDRTGYSHPVEHAWMQVVGKNNNGSPDGLYYIHQYTADNGLPNYHGYSFISDHFNKKELYVTGLTFELVEESMKEYIASLSWEQVQEAINNKRYYWNVTFVIDVQKYYNQLKLDY